MADDATILIRNPDVVRDIRKLAAQTGQAEADAVAEAVRARLEPSAPPAEENATERRRQIDTLLAEIDALPHDGEPLTDADLYDEDGMPR